MQITKCFYTTLKFNLSQLLSVGSSYELLFAMVLNNFIIVAYFMETLDQISDS
jgi:hypothetical protein